MPDKDRIIQAGEEVAHPAFWSFAMNNPLHPGDALLLIDVQRDFCAGGSLPVAEGDQIVDVLNRWIKLAEQAHIPIIATRDWHPVGHISFKAQGGPWPEHCVQDTSGAAFHPALALPAEAVRVSKGTRFDEDAYSVFQNTGLASYLQHLNIRRLWVGGLALDVCVNASIRDAQRLGFTVHLLAPATRAVDPKAGTQTLQALRQAGVIIEEEA